MAIPDLTNLTADELITLITNANTRYHAIQAAEEQENADLRTAIDGSIAQLETLLGPEGGPASADSIRGVLAYSDEQMVAAAGLAFRLAFTGLAEVTRITLDIARVVSRDND